MKRSSSRFFFRVILLAAGAYGALRWCPTHSVLASTPLVRPATAAAWDTTTPPTPTSIAPITSPKADAELTPTNLPLVLPGPAKIETKRDARVAALEAKIAKVATFEAYRALAERHLQLGNSAEAARVFRLQATLYRRKGLEDAAQIQERFAAQNEPVLRLFAARADAASQFSDAPLEPSRGCYLGAFIDRDDALTQRFVGDNFQQHRLPSEFRARVGRGLGSVFTYVKWGNFPKKWLRMCKSQGVIPQIAWEPRNISEVRDDAYLRDCEAFLRELDWPVWIRFAGEMNGKWTPYHNNPALYREKFRLVHRVLHRNGAHVATIWCVNSIPLGNIAAYYPGDDACDWVGLNLYSVPFLDNDPARPALRDSPLTLLDPIYRKYSARKPIAICEYAASHQAALDKRMRPEFAVEKLSLLYGALPLLYPRVKMVSWYDSNNLLHAQPGRQLNNYRLTELSPITRAFFDVTDSPYFLQSYPPDAVSAPALREIKVGEALQSGERVWIWATGATARPALYLQINGRVIYASNAIGKRALDLPPNAGAAVVLVYDGKRCVARREVRIVGR